MLLFHQITFAHNAYPPLADKVFALLIFVIASFWANTAVAACEPPQKSYRLIHSFADPSFDRVDFVTALAPSMRIHNESVGKLDAVQRNGRKGITIHFCLVPEAIGVPGWFTIGGYEVRIPEIIASNNGDGAKYIEETPVPRLALITDVRRGTLAEGDGMILSFHLSKAGTRLTTVSPIVALKWEIDAVACSDPSPNQIRIQLELAESRERAIWRDGDYVYDDLIQSRSYKVRPTAKVDLCVGYLEVTVDIPTLAVDIASASERISIVFDLPRELERSLGESLRLTQWKLSFPNDPVLPATISEEYP